MHVVRLQPVLQDVCCCAQPAVVMPICCTRRFRDLWVNGAGTTLKQTDMYISGRCPRLSGAFTNACHVATRLISRPYPVTGALNHRTRPQLAKFPAHVLWLRAIRSDQSPIMPSSSSWDLYLHLDWLAAGANSTFVGSILCCRLDPRTWSFADNETNLCRRTWPSLLLIHSAAIHCILFSPHTDIRQANDADSLTKWHLSVSPT